MDAPPLDYCRQIETYLCRKNDGHLIRVTGPSFEIVSAWEARGVPFKVACEGIDRAFERYHRKGPRRRPLKIDFCDADVLDVFEEWQRAVGITHTVEAPSKSASLPAHLSRVVRRLSEARADGRLGESFDAVIDRIAEELDRVRAERHGVRGEARQALLERLSRLDAELIAVAWTVLSSEDRVIVETGAVEALAPYRVRMTPEAFDRARAAAEERLLRDRVGLPNVAPV